MKQLFFFFFFFFVVTSACYFLRESSFLYRRAFAFGSVYEMQGLHAILGRQAERVTVNNLVYSTDKTHTSNLYRVIVAFPRVNKEYSVFIPIGLMCTCR